jgi:hypothetical protein
MKSADSSVRTRLLPSKVDYFMPRGKQNRKNQRDRAAATSHKPDPSDFSFPSLSSGLVRANEKALSDGHWQPIEQ